MSSLRAVIICTILLLVSCGPGVRAQQGQNAAPKSNTTSRLNSEIPPPNPRKYRNIRDGKDWRNPFLVVNRDGVSLSAKAASITEWKPVSLKELSNTLIALPRAAWPYGRVIGVMENPLRSGNDNELIKQNKDKTEKILRSLGLTIDWWPSA